MVLPSKTPQIPDPSDVGIAREEQALLVDGRPCCLAMAGERLAVYCFKSMEEIVRFEGQNDHNELISEVKFSKLELVSLPNLLSFYAKKEKMGSSSACAQLLFNVKVIFPVLYELSIAGVGVIEIWDKKSIAVFEAQGSFCQLKSVYIQSCSKLLHVARMATRKGLWKNGGNSWGSR